jgi:subtilase family serine protease
MNMIGRRIVLSAIAFCSVLLFAPAVLNAQTSSAGGITGIKAGVQPAAVRGPAAIPANVAGPNYGLFGCQVGLSTGACYDPYQMRHAYTIDTLINAGFDGWGKTIVIVDAFQSPNIVAAELHSSFTVCRA